MFQGKFIFSQLMELAPRYEFKKCVAQYNGAYKVKHFSCWQQFLCMSFGQITYRDSLTDVVVCLNAQRSKAYHCGITSKVILSTLTRANERRDWRIYAAFAYFLITEARLLYADDKTVLPEVDELVYALDSTTIDLCLSVFRWAKFRDEKAAIKLHTLLDVKAAVPTFIHITDGFVHDVNILDLLKFEAGAIYVMDRGYVDFARLFAIHQAVAFYVIRAKSNFQFERIYSAKVDRKTGIICDQTIKLTGYNTAKFYPEMLRRIKYYDKETDKTLVFLTNNFPLPALTIALLYKHRWKIELFFKWIKQHLKIKAFWGYSPNAVKTQVWTAIATYVLVVIMKKRFKLEQSLYEILQILSITVFEKMQVNQLFQRCEIQKTELVNHNQLNLFDL
jgi:hypothetical protein